MERVTLARSGDPFPGAAYDQPCYRIPALAVTPSGRLVAVWDVRADWRDLPGAFDLAYRTSDDSGCSWGPARVLRRHTSQRGFGDASLIVDPATGRIHCWHVASTGPSFFTAAAGASGAGLELWLATSADDGESWEFRDFSALKPEWAGGMFAASGNGIALARGTSAGALLQPFVLRDPLTSAHYAAVGTSSDGGESWHLGDVIGPDCDEGKVVELNDGSILLHARATPRRRRAVSGNAGVTFGPVTEDPTLVDPACNGGLGRWGGRLVCSLLDDEATRRRLALRLSDDDGSSWSATVLVDGGAAGYSVVVELPDGDLGLAYEFGNYEGIAFVRIARDEVGWDGSGPTLIPVAGTAGAALPPETAMGGRAGL